MFVLFAAEKDLQRLKLNFEFDGDRFHLGSNYFIKTISVEFLYTWNKCISFFFRYDLLRLYLRLKNKYTLINCFAYLWFFAVFVLRNIRLFYNSFDETCKSNYWFRHIGVFELCVL